MDEETEILQAELLEEFRVSAAGHVEGEPIVRLVEDLDIQTAAAGPHRLGQLAQARDVAADHAKLALKARGDGKRVAILSGGELTVTVRGNGRGGPNQEYALSLTGLLKDTSGISALAADTDGADGGAGSADDPAGAIIDQNTFAKMRSLGLDAKPYLDNNDATAFFAATGDLLLTGPTLTNVNDIRVILVDGE